MFKNTIKPLKISSYLTEVDDLEIKLTNIGYFIKTTVGTTPLKLVYQLTGRLNKIKAEITEMATASSKPEFELLDNKINKCLLKLKDYEKFFLLHNNEATAIAEAIEEKHSASISDWKDYFYNDKYNYGYKPLFKPDNNVFQNSLNCYIKIWEILNPIIPELNDHFEKYKDNSLAQLFFNDQNFISALKGSQFFSGGTIGHCIIQRLFFLKSYNLRLTTKILNSLAPGGVYHTVFEKDFFNYDSNAFKAEIIKLVLYQRLSLEKSTKPIAWIGSANTLTKMLEYSNCNLNAPERSGIYLNCGEYLTPEFNRGWLLALLEMGYEIKLVERQFPNIEQAILSDNVVDFLVLLANEIRKMDKYNDPTGRHSQYHGGDSPTATSLEILLLMSMGCRATRDFDEGTISLAKPKAPCIELDIVSSKFNSSYDKPITFQHHLKQRRQSFSDSTSAPNKTVNQLIVANNRA